jgi:soluble lytic murein transglycosylase
MALGVKLIRSAGVIVSRWLTVFLVLIYLGQAGAIAYLIYDKMETQKTLNQQQQKIKELEEKLKIFHVIEDFQVGFNQKEVGELVEVIHGESKKYGYDPLLLISIILTESSFRREQVSYLGAEGLMQLKPSVGFELAQRRNLQWLGEKSLFVSTLNIRLGALHLFELILKYKDVKQALIAYNLGEETLRLCIKEGRVVPDGFVYRVIHRYKELKEKYNS